MSTLWPLFARPGPVRKLTGPVQWLIPFAFGFWWGTRGSTATVNYLNDPHKPVEMRC